MKYFNPGISNHLFKIDFILTTNGMFIILTFKKWPKKLLKRQHTFVGRIYFRVGYKTFDERFECLDRWVSQIDFEELKAKFFKNETARQPIIYFGRELKIDFNSTLEEIFEEDLLENSWKKSWDD